VASNSYTYLGLVTTTTAAPSLESAASRMLDHYLACVAGHSWENMVSETHREQECLNFSCKPSTATADVPRHLVSELKAAKALLTDQQSGKHQANTHKCEQKMKRRATWVATRKANSRPAGGHAPANGASAAAAPLAATVSVKPTAAEILAGAVPHTTVVATQMKKQQQPCQQRQPQAQKQQMLLGTLFDPCRLAYLAYTSND
jgi:hypothetical protein